MKCSHECNCECHDPNVRMLHFMACCEKCPQCGKMIKNQFSHKKECHSENQSNE